METQESTMNYQCWFHCINPECGANYDIKQIIYHCEKCGSLLEVAHDTGVLQTKSADYWKDLFDRRYKVAEWPYGSTVWGKKEWICPAVDNDNVVSMYEGGSNLFWAERLGKMVGVEDLWIKLCGNSHTGSFKDLGMTVLVSMVKQMIADGAEIQAVACASTGDTSASLASYCACAGIPSVVLLPKGKISTAQLIQPISNGAITVCLDTDFDGCMAVVKELTKEKRIYLANSMNSLRIEGQAALADMTGLFNCPHTGVALAVTLKLIKRGDIKPSDRVVVISTAHGLKFSGFKVDYHNRDLEEVASYYANDPIELPADLSSVKKALFQRIEKWRPVEIDWDMWS